MTQDYFLMGVVAVAGALWLAAHYRTIKQINIFHKLFGRVFEDIRRIQARLSKIEKGKGP